MTATKHVQQWFALPTSARDWLLPGERAGHWCPSAMSASDELAAFDQLAQWDQVVGRMTRVMLFDDDENPRNVRINLQAIAAVAEALAVRLGQERL